MKKILKLTFSFLLLTLSVAYSRTNQSEVPLHENEVFQNLIKETIEFNFKASQNIDFNKEISKQLLEEVNNLKIQNASDEVVYTKLNSLYKFNDEHYIKSHFEKLGSYIATLHEVYGDKLNDKIYLNEEANLAIEAIGENTFSNEDDCLRKWRYAICVVGVAAEAAALGSVCTAITAGIGLAACLAGTIAFQIDHSLECHDKYC